MLPFGLSTVVWVSAERTSSSVNPIAASLAGSTLTLTAGFCCPATKTCATPEICESCWEITFSA